MRHPVPLLLALAACAGWNNLPTQSSTTLARPLWDAERAVPSQHGVYVPLPFAGGLALVSSEGKEGKATRIDLGEGRLRKLFASPEGSTVVGFVERTWCDWNKDDKAPELVIDCPEDLQVNRTEVSVIRGEEVADPVELDGIYNAIQWSENGTYAVAYLDLSDPDLQLEGVVSLTSVYTIDLTTNELNRVSVGFAPDRVLFVEEPEGPPQRAVVLSRNEVAVLDLTLDPPERVTSFPLTLDPDTTVTPVGVELTPDGRYALISVQGRSDLYALDLENRSINIVELSSVPSDMAVNTALDRTVLVYSGGSAVDILEHDLFDIDTLTLDEPMTDVASASSFAVLYNTGSGHDAYKLDLATNTLTEYRLENPAVSLSVAPTEEFAIALTRAEGGFGGGGGAADIADGYPGMEILDLTDDEAIPFLLEGQGLSISWATKSTGDVVTALHALVLQEGIDYLFKLDLYTGQDEEIELAEPPIAVGSMPDGTFYITHPNPLGLITFYDPSDDSRTEVSGFAVLGMNDQIELGQPPKEKK